MLSAVIRDMMAFSPSAKGSGGTRNAPYVVAALLCVFVPFEVSHLLFMLLGAVLYLLATAPSTVGRAVPRKAETPVCARKVFQPRLERASKAAKDKVVIQPERRAQPHSVPSLTAPTFKGSGWEAEVNELLEQITPTPACGAAVTKLTRKVQEAVRPLYPGAQVTGYVNGSLTGGKAFGVAVPDVEIVVSLCPAQLLRKNDMRAQKDHMDASQPLKNAIRLCIDRLVNSVGLKFRRSAFRGREPKVTFLAPTSLGFCGESIPLDFSINALTPWRNAALLEELSRSEPHVKALVLLVKRWAKDRGICHAAKGHLPPYAWTLLCIYYLQVGDDALLAPIDAAALRLRHAGQAFTADTWQNVGRRIHGAFAQGAAEPEDSGDQDFAASLRASAVARLQAEAERAARRQEDKDIAQGVVHEAIPTSPKPETVATAGPSAAELLKGFIHFYASEFNWSREVVSVRLGRRAPEDPFDHAYNLGEGMTLESLKRLQEELCRAETLCARDASLAVLLEPWVPTDTEKVEAKGK